MAEVMYKSRLSLTNFVSVSLFTEKKTKRNECATW